MSCKKSFECYDKPKGQGTGMRGKAKRPHNSVTCSKKCTLKHNYATRNRKSKEVTNE